MNKFYLNNAVIVSSITEKILIKTTRVNNAWLPKKLIPTNLQCLNKRITIEFTIGINTKNKGFWVKATDDPFLNAYYSYKQLKQNMWFDRFCYDGITKEFGINEPWTLFKQPTKIGVKIV